MHKALKWIPHEYPSSTLENTIHFYFCSGELAEWSNAAVLKTVDLCGSGGSNPSLSAKKQKAPQLGRFLFLDFRSQARLSGRRPEIKTTMRQQRVLFLATHPNGIIPMESV
jgi:hypothetical protein